MSPTNWMKVRSLRWELPENRAHAYRVETHIKLPPGWTDFDQFRTVLALAGFSSRLEGEGYLVAELSALGETSEEAMRGVLRLLVAFRLPRGAQLAWMRSEPMAADAPEAVRV